MVWNLPGSSVRPVGVCAEESRWAWVVQRAAARCAARRNDRADASGSGCPVGPPVGHHRRQLSIADSTAARKYRTTIQTGQVRAGVKAP